LLAKAAERAARTPNDRHVCISTQAHLVTIRIIRIERLLASLPDHAGTRTDAIDAESKLAGELVVRNEDTHATLQAHGALFGAVAAIHEAENRFDHLLGFADTKIDSDHADLPFGQRAQPLPRQILG
jgi:hypothetical protein